MTTASYISIAAIVVLESPRSINPEKGQRNIAFDANFFARESTRSKSMGLLRYFVTDEIANEISPDGYHKAFIVANVCFYFWFEILL